MLSSLFYLLDSVYSTLSLVQEEKYERVRIMLKLNKTFAQAFRDGEITVSDIHDYVAYWHKHDTGSKLYQFLGMTIDEFESWVAGSDVDLYKILNFDELPMEEVPVCRVCGSPMGVKTAIGILAKSNYIDADICRDCLVENCCHTNCVDCKIGDHPNCSYLSLKEYYLSNNE